jgi:LysR family transcriptional regulator, transcription activator of glutamate synthase operon
LIELRQLRYAEAVARHRHFTRAAEELLFERTSRSVVPTEAGEAVAARARRVLAEVDGVRGEVDELRGLVRGRVWVGALLPAGGMDVPRLLVQFSEAFPGVEMGLREGTAGDMLRYLAEDEVDAAFSLLATDVPDDLEAAVRSEDELAVAFPPGSGPDRETVSAAELARHTIVTPRSGSAIKQALDEFFARAGEPLHIALESGDPFLLRTLVSTGFGAAVLPRSLTEREGPPVDVRGLRPAVRLPVTLLWRRNRHQSPAARAFIDFAQENV